MRLSLRAHQQSGAAVRHRCRVVGVHAECEYPLAKTGPALLPSLNSAVPWATPREVATQQSPNLNRKNHDRADATVFRRMARGPNRR